MYQTCNYVAKGRKLKKRRKKARALNRVLMGEILFYKIQLEEETNEEEGQEQR